MRVRAAGIILSAVMLAAGCSRTDGDRQDILNTLETRSRALNSHNAGQYFSVISRYYSDKGKDFDRLRNSIEKNFGEYERICYESDAANITVNGSTAVAVGTYRMTVRIKGREMTLNGTERLTLAKEPTGWKIISGI